MGFLFGDTRTHTHACVVVNAAGISRGLLLYSKQTRHWVEEVPFSNPCLEIGKFEPGLQFDWLGNEATADGQNQELSTARG